MKELSGNYLIHTETAYWSGKIVGFDGKFITIVDAAWIPDTGRYADAFYSGKFDEVEPVPGMVMIPLEKITAIVQWPHPLPRVQS